MINFYSLACERLADDEASEAMLAWKRLENGLLGLLAWG